jgi:hypothetical protein
MEPRFDTIAGHEWNLAAVELLRRAGGDVESTIRGDSMHPTLPAGARIKVTCRQQPRYACGAVVAFLAGDVLVGHRVVGHCSDRQGRQALLLRGDARLLCDPPVDPALVLGEVTAWQQDSGWRPLAPAPRLAWPGRWAAASVLAGVRRLARYDLPRVSRWHEAVLALLIRARRRLRSLRASHD